MENMWVRFYLRTLEEFYDQETLERFCTLLVSLGFRLQDFSEPIIMKITPETTPGVTLLMRHTIDTYLKQHGKDFTIKAYSVGNVDMMDLNFMIHFYPIEGYFVFSIDQERFFSDESERESYQNWLELLPKLYDCWHPFYVHEFFRDGFMIDYERVLKKQIDYLYETNIFGPELVEMIGRERLLKAPAWKVEELADGAIYLVPRVHFFSHGTPTLVEVAQAVGMESPELSEEELKELYDSEETE